MSVPAPRYLWKSLVLAAALGFVYWVMLRRLGYDWWTDENYSHGLLIPFIIGYILWTERERLRRATHRPSLAWGGAAVICALLALWAGTAGAEIYIQRLSLVLMLAGIAVYFWGFRLLKLLLVPFVLLLLAIPIPAIIFNKIAFPLQLFASRCAVWAMRLFEIPVLRQGNVIELKPLNAVDTKKLEVVEACSGIRSLMTLVTLAVVFAYFTHPQRDQKGDQGSGRGGEGGGGGGRSGRRGGWPGALGGYPFWRAFILVASAVPIAIATNALRVSGTGVLAHYYGTEVADGFFHSFSGWVVYIVAFLLLLVVGWLLDRVGGRGGGDRGNRTGATVSRDGEAEKKETFGKKAGMKKAPVGVLPVEGAE
jgi:exosortase